ncbi:MAG: glycoside hydrolase family 15 protein [Ferrovibrio sp.]|uniref:glycoside hydrolase family 15 protein n=1 Tax=Ferrovibrio sp. TaxID=1917215 RepID=UPI002635CAF1|nr:glycoside hydrolase family 15 protein [Ferrovibrio sp.]MCW0235752.1 glycoside hydrolase family 15 protein [Ferrovibrio sp.]
MRLEDLGLIGNCQVSALVERSGSIVWCCLPRFDSEPLFGRLLDPEGGEFAVAPADGGEGVQSYRDNSNVLQTDFVTPTGRFRVIDFAPRFMLNDRMFRPTQIIRIIEPLEGAPMVRVRFDPLCGWSKQRPRLLHGSNHVHVEGLAAPLRLTSDISPTHLDGHPFALTGRRHLVLAWGIPVEQSLAPLCTQFLEQTERYWQRWVKHCNVPARYQREVIRSALALKLHCFEDTGAIVAAMTTSIPEARGSGRTWDYRYCWLRDSYYVLEALRLLGHFEERESFVQYLIGVCASAPDLDLRPLYRVDGSADLEERILPEWAGFNGDGPVRIGNGAALHQQHDVYGEMVLALAPVYMDERFSTERTGSTLKLLERLARKAIEVAGTPDAGIWEFRKAWEPQTFSSVMCWAAADRMEQVAARHLPSRAAEFRAAADRIHTQILNKSWIPERGAFASAYGGTDLDAALLQMVPLRFLNFRDPMLASSVDAIASELGNDGWMYRYRSNDGLGVPEVAFVICSFWLIEALAITGREETARRALDGVLTMLSPLGLIAEDYDATNRTMWGNFPQAYSHVGLIHAAFAASPRWDDLP